MKRTVEVLIPQKTIAPTATQIGRFSLSEQKSVWKDLVAFFRENNRWPQSFEELQSGNRASGRTNPVLDACAAFQVTGTVETGFLLSYELGGQKVTMAAKVKTTEQGQVMGLGVEAKPTTPPKGKANDDQIEKK